MRNTLLAFSAAATLALPTLAAAQAPAAAKSPHVITGNIALVSQYRFRGIDQTFGKPALQGGFDYAHEPTGIYLGNWNSNVNEGAGFPGGNLEMDFYGGWKKAFGDFGLDIGAIYYYYPGTDSQNGLIGQPTNNRTNIGALGRVDNKEVYIGGSWKWLSAKIFYALDDYFSVPGTKHTTYLDLAANYDLGNGWGVNGHVGRLRFKGMNNGNYTDWKLGVTKDISGWVLGASYVDTNAKGNCSNAFATDPYCFPNSSGTKAKDAGRGALVLSVSKTF